MKKYSHHHLLSPMDFNNFKDHSMVLSSMITIDHFNSHSYSYSKNTISIDLLSQSDYQHWQDQ